jgi:hypothetical protein
MKVVGKKSPFVVLCWRKEREIKMKLKTKYLLKWRFRKYYKYVLLALLIILLVYCLLTFGKNIDTKNPSIIGIIGVLSGSALTGLLTYINTGRAHLRETKKKEMEYRKKEIYIPLYENIFRFFEDIKLDEYPEYLNNDPNFEKKLGGFTEWNKIKKDARYLSINKNLEKELDELTEMIAKYNAGIEDFVDEIHKVIDRHVDKVFYGSQRVHHSFKFRELRYLLKDKDIFISRLTNATLVFKEPFDWSKSKIPYDVAEQIYNEAMQLPSTIYLNKQYCMVRDKTQELLELFETTIKEINKNIFGYIDY